MLWPFVLKEVVNLKTSKMDDGRIMAIYFLSVASAIFSLLALGVYTSFMEFIDIEGKWEYYIMVPRNIEDVTALANIFNEFKETYFYSALYGVFVAHVFLQTFAIPGSVLLVILSGFLFPKEAALILICFSSATGASFCYTLFWLLGSRKIYKYFPQKVQDWSENVKLVRESIVGYIMFLRIIPCLPNWLINIVSPVIGVPLLPFWFATFVGVSAPSLFAIQVGAILNQLMYSTEIVDWKQFLIPLALGGVSLIPFLWRKPVPDIQEGCVEVVEEDPSLQVNEVSSTIGGFKCDDCLNSQRLNYQQLTFRPTRRGRR